MFYTLVLFRALNLEEAVMHEEMDIQVFNVWRCLKNAIQPEMREKVPLPEKANHISPPFPESPV